MAPAAPPGKSFRFVRACERAGARAARDHLRLPRAFCGTNVSFVVFVCPRLVFFFFTFSTTKNAQNVSRLMIFALVVAIVHIKTNVFFTCLCFFHIFAQGCSLQMQLVDQNTALLISFIRCFLRPDS